jgi:hypothetical protein
VNLEHSDEWAEVAAALGKAQAKIENPTKSKTATVQMTGGGKYSYNYSDLASVLDACREPFADNGLTIIQPPAAADRGISVQTIIAHTSGQWLGCTLHAASGPRPQDMASVITYLRRYGLQSLAGLAAEDDESKLAEQHGPGHRNDHRNDNHQQRGPSGPIQPPQRRSETARPATPPPDGPPHPAEEPPHPAAPAPATAAPLQNELPPERHGPYVTEPQLKRFWVLVREAGWRDEELKTWLKRTYGLSSTKDITQAEYEKVCAAVRAGTDPQGAA